MKNHPSVIKKLRILINQHQQEHPESAGWSLQQAQHALVKLNAPLSEQDAQAMFTYIDQHGNSDGLLQYADFDGLMEVQRSTESWHCNHEWCAGAAGAVGRAYSRYN